MAVSGVSSATSATAASSGAFAQLGTSDFLKVMFSELQNQDPMNPQDSSKLLEQLSSLRNIESQLSLQDKMTSLVLQDQISAAGGMIGKQVTGVDENGDALAGLVTSVRVKDSQVQLELDSGQSLAMERVTAIAPAVAGATLTPTLGPQPAAATAT